MITLILSTAVLCFDGTCYSALVGHTTPVGTFDTFLRLTEDEGYGGDVIQFYETADQVLAIHRTWLLNKSQRREQRLRSNNVADRYITKGCINIEPSVYEKLRSCCIGQKLVIQP
jgi:hypothetical protein